MTPKRMRLTAVLAILLGGVIGIIGSTQTWLDVTLSDGAQQTVAVPGADALSVLAPLSLAALALGLALTIVGRTLRHVFALVGAALAVGLGWGAVRIATTAPVDAVAGPVTEATGLSGTEGISRIVAGITVTPWPWVTAVAAVLILAGAVLALATAHRWTSGGRKYRTETEAPVAGPRDAIDSWDDLSRGEDPTR